MKLADLGARDRRAMLWGLAILVPSLGWVYALRPFRAALSDARDQVAVEREALARERSAILEASRNPARQRTADSAMHATEPRLFAGSNDVAASAELVAYLGDVAHDARIWLADAATRPAAALADGVRALRVEVRAESDFEGLLTFLQALERGGKLVRVERLDATRTARVGEEDIETLAISATVVGYALAGGDSGRGSAP